MLTGKECRDKAIHCRHMAETTGLETAVDLEMLASEFDLDGRLADVEAYIVRRASRTTA